MVLTREFQNSKSLLRCVGFCNETQTWNPHELCLCFLFTLRFISLQFRNFNLSGILMNIFLTKVHKNYYRQSKFSSQYVVFISHHSWQQYKHTGVVDAPTFSTRQLENIKYKTSWQTKHKRYMLSAISQKGKLCPKMAFDELTQRRKCKIYQ